MEDRNPTQTCTAAERTLLDSIAALPGIKATATIHANGSWSLGTEEAEVQRWVDRMAANESN